MHTFREAIGRKDLVVSADLPLRPTSTASDIAAAVAVLAPVVDAVQLDDNREAAGNMSALAAASLVMKSGLDAIVHMTCRDRNEMALQADLLGAAALGITTLLLARGEKLSGSKTLRGKGVFDIRATRLTEMAKWINDKTDLVSAPGFLIGTLIAVFDPDEDWEASRIQEKIDVGARFLQTQPCLNVELLRRYMKELVTRKVLRRASVIVEVPLLTSRELARDYKIANPSALLPEASVARIMAASDATAEGIAVCAAVLKELGSIPGVAGANIKHDTAAENVAAVIQQAGLR
ncbi:MAG: methylenetetrahydrofolate reductase [Proteobacteria bacterium]|nr:methylenetetrahydrofolate reductase [Pseudomonadota bacterium]